MLPIDFPEQEAILLIDSAIQKKHVQNSPESNNITT